MSNVDFGKRKVIKESTSYRITLPKRWVERQGIMKGDLLRIEMNRDGNLLIKVKP